ncbi:glycosyltransferase family 2 protein [candidate division KSB1 bacterium]|nr:glycosyltransferase family 2 protein [candidate division KSB1 bacterium]NIR70388.1 glycosyltransferase family 2 protein [candidate division KSB1 bacterium]NIS23067.1 glycosyltransferase family 2 protein [candidate division KSB1 bacterium]NIT71441.1 glycosyltransferase family 2 protein [candidate division KSB1 bacterium]NIU25115.1 glycosyltransferase family 2 protein [candidate division KSB1 bacterium]
MSVLAFWISLGSLFFVYAGFAMLVIIVGAVLNREVRKESITPSVSMIIAAYNEESSIAEKLDSVLELDYPKDRLEIIVASDGSDDGTEAIVSMYADCGVRLLSLPRRGKIHALNDAVAEAKGDILVFSDANSIYDKKAVRELVSNFADPKVGGVGGNTIYTTDINGDTCGHGENLYWNYDKWLKEMESRTGSIISAHGAIYAIRRELYQPQIDSAVTDDFAISTSIIEQGYRLVFEKEARAYEVAIPAANREFWRKVRMMTRGLRGVLLRKALLNPFRYGFYSLILFTHKFLRRLVSVMLLFLFVSSITLISDGLFYRVCAISQSIFYVLAGIGFLLKDRRIGHLRVLYIPFFYCLANSAALVALINIIRGHQIERWQPQRHSPGSAKV